MKTKPKKLNFPVIIIFYVLAAAFFAYGVYMLIYSIGYVNAYQGSTTIGIDNNFRYIVSSSASYFGFAFLLLAAAVILNSFNNIRSGLSFDDTRDDFDDYYEDQPYNRTDAQLSIDDIMDSNKSPEPEPEMQEAIQQDVFPEPEPEFISESKPEFVYEPKPEITPEAEPVEAEPEFERIPDLEAIFESDPVPEPEVIPEPEFVSESKPEPEVEVKPEPEIVAKPEPIPEPEPVVEDKPEPEAVSDDEIMVEQVKLEKRKTPIQIDNISSTMIKDIFEKK
ncbi:MAG: hypothetical protein GX663_08415 [Clostridiales bacterium]|nr:hypothetical protein [Clostridiales bacterium]